MGRLQRTCYSIGIILAITFGSLLPNFLHRDEANPNWLIGLPNDAVDELSYKTICQPPWMLGKNLAGMTGSQVMEYFMWGNGSSCRLHHDFGGHVLVVTGKIIGVDGQKAVCIDPSSLSPNRQGNCTVYSFGINNEWSFDDAMERYGCQVYAFDPSMTEAEDEFDRSPSIHFYKLGLGDRDDTIKESGWRMRTLSTIYRLLNHEDRDIDYLKIDIEGTEWEVLPQIIESGMLARVRQMGVEVHLPANETLERYKELAGILHVMENQHGMVRFDSKANPWTKSNFTQLGLLDFTSCYEIAWYNNRYL